MRRVALGAALAIAACGPAGSGTPAGSEGGATSGTSEGLPAHAPARFGFGAEAPEARIAMWDIDVRPDGAGLPAGSGSVDEGRQVYETFCVECHGPTGTEGPNDRLVSTDPWDDVGGPAARAIGSYWQYPATLFDYIRKAMPQTTPGVLTADETYGVIAYILSLNGLVPYDVTMDAGTLPAVVMPARDRFVPDDRRGGLEVR